MRFAEIADKKYVKNNKLEEAADTDGDSEITEDDDDIKEGWMTLKILEASEVNGVRFPEGVKIDVHADDAKKLLEAKKAELISMKIEEATDNTTEANQSTDENTEEIETIEARSEPTWLPPDPFLSLGVKVRLFYERLRARTEL